MNRPQCNKNSPDATAIADSLLCNRTQNPTLVIQSVITFLAVQTSDGRIVHTRYPNK